MRMKAATAISAYTTATIRTYLMAWKLYHRTIKNAAGVVKALETKFLLET